MHFITLIFVPILGSVLNFHPASASLWGAPSCTNLVDRFQRDHGQHATFKNASSAFIFFLHVPRTAGKTYASCFLKSALRPTERCAPSYDFLRLNISQEGCRYIVSHDDYSLTEMLPKDNTLVLTQLRDPVSRVLSAYEFGIEVAARRVHVDDDQYASANRNVSFVNTLNVWPWSYVVPFFRRDMRSRMEALEAQATAPNTTHPRVWTSHIDPKTNRTYYWAKELNQSVWTLPPANLTLDPYNNDLVTPLSEWIESEDAQELIHDGATLQILGITNYSHWKEDARALRRCFFDDKTARRRLIDMAKDRLRHMHHVGLTEKLDQSVAALAAGLGYNVSSATTWRGVGRNVFSYDAPGFDINQYITYNMTREKGQGETVTMTVLQARRLVIDLSKDVGELNRELKKMEPELQKLVDLEDEWLDSGGKWPEDENADGTGGDGGDGGTGGGKSKKKTEVQSTGITRKLSKWLQTMIDSLKSVLNWPPTAQARQDYEAAGNSGGGGGGRGGGNEGYGDGSYLYPEEGEHIDSPWAEEIEAMDAKVYEKQQRRDALMRDITALQAIPAVKGPPQPEGPAKLLLPENDFHDDTPLGAAYRRCSQGATKRAADKRKGAFRSLMTPWHESFAFSSSVRKALPAGLVRRIRELNGADEEVYALGRQLLASAEEEMSALGVYEALPPVSTAEEGGGKGGGGRGRGAGAGTDQRPRQLYRGMKLRNNRLLRNRMLMLMWQHPYRPLRSTQRWRTTTRQLA